MGSNKDVNTSGEFVYVDFNSCSIYLTFNSYFSVYHLVMVHVGSLEITKETEEWLEVQLRVTQAS